MPSGSIGATYNLVEVDPVGSTCLTCGEISGMVLCALDGGVAAEQLDGTIAIEKYAARDVPAESVTTSFSTYQPFVRPLTVTVRKFPVVPLGVTVGVAGSFGFRIKKLCVRLRPACEYARTSMPLRDVPVSHQYEPPCLCMTTTGGNTPSPTVT